MTKLTRTLQSLYVGPLLFAGMLSSGAACAQTLQLRTESTVETLRSGETWESSAVRLKFDLNSEAGRKVYVDLERSQRPSGDAELARLAFSATLDKGNALYLSAAHGAGAAYGVRQQQQVSWYTSLSPVEAHLGYEHNKYREDQQHRLRLDFRAPLAPHLTGLVGVAAGQSASQGAGHTAHLGAEWQGSRCTWSVVGHSGTEAERDNNGLPSNTRSTSIALGARCQISSKLSVAAKLIDVKAKALSRKGVYGGLVFDI